MEKAKINYDILKQEETVELVGKNGDKIHVRRNISYEEKEALAYELVAGVFVIDDEAKVCYTSYKKPLYETYLRVKYYTDIDVGNVDEEGYAKLFDYMVMNELYEKVMNVIMYDYSRCVEEIVWLLKTASETVYEKQNSLGGKLEKVFGFLFTGEDLTEQIAAAEDINGKMVDMFKAVKERDEKNALLKGGKAKVSAGGAVLNMAKK